MYELKNIEVKIKEVPRVSGMKLEEYGKSKFPGCNDVIQANRKNGRWITGIDEKSFDILAMPNGPEKEEKIEKVKALREHLEGLLQKDLSATSDFWIDYLVEIDTTTVLNLMNPKHVIMYHFLLANNVVMPDESLKNELRYTNALYAFYREDQDVTEKVANARKKNEAKAKLNAIFKKSPSNLKKLAMYLSLPIREHTPEENVYDAVDTFIENDKTTNGVSKFLSAAELTPDEIGIKLTLDEAVRNKIIRKNGNVYQRGSVTLGRDYTAMINFLQLPENANELQSIIDELSFKKNY